MVNDRQTDVALYVRGALLDMDGVLVDSTASKGEFTGLNGNKGMAQMVRFRDPGTNSLQLSAFSSFSGDLDLNPQRIVSRQINLDFYGIAVDGSGSVDKLNSRLDFKGNATIQT